MFFFAFSFSFLVFQSENLVSAQNVLDWIPHTNTNQMAFPSYKKSDIIKTADIELKSPNGHSYRAKCEDYRTGNPKVDVITSDGIPLDTLILTNLETDPCAESFLKNYIIPQDPEKGKEKMIYLWSGKSPDCVGRDYRVHDFPFLATVAKSDYPRVACPAPVADFIKRFPDGKKAGGIVNVGPEGFYMVDYNAHVVARSVPKYLEFPTKDLKGKVFKLKCQEDGLKSEDPETKKYIITTGSIVHEDNDEIILDKFKLTTCSTDGVNVNRQIFNNVNRFKVVFKTAKKVCYEREYEFYNVNSLHYFDKITVLRTWPKKVNCPKTFVGDIDVNARRSWFKRLFGKVLRKPKQFSVEY